MPRIAATTTFTALITATLGASGAAQAQGVSLVQLVNLHDRDAEARAVSGDGSVTVGQMRFGSFYWDESFCATQQMPRGARWAPDGGLVELFGYGEYVPQCDHDQEIASAHAVSPDGQVIAGSARDEDGDDFIALWLGGEAYPSILIDLSDAVTGAITDVANDRTIIGYFDERPFVALDGGEFTELPAGPTQSGRALAISGDGTRIVGNLGEAETSWITAAIAWTHDGATWTAETLVPETSSAEAISANGEHVAGSTFTGADVFFFIASGDTVDVFPNDGFGGVVAISDDGNRVAFARHVWDRASGAQSVFDILDDAGVVPDGWTADDLRIADMSDDGTVFVGKYDHSGDPDVAIRATIPFGTVDTDGDGLLDDWEENGIPYIDGAGEERRYVLDIDGDGTVDANPTVIDIFVEIDAMGAPGLAPSPADLQRVVDAFASAPVTGVHGETGIALHLDFSHMATETIDDLADGLGTDFLAYKATWFGNDGESAPALEARRQAFRYCVFANRQGGGSSSGQAELGGNDFIVTLGGWTPAGGTSEEKAGTFMHELGHTLGLTHGGPDSQLNDDERDEDRNRNRKPNYYSIMNYLWQTPMAWHDPGSWPLASGGAGYARHALWAVDERDLDEAAGLVPPDLAAAYPAPGFAVPYNVERFGKLPVDLRNAFMAIGEPVDWNDNALIDPYDPSEPIRVDINRCTPDAPPSGSTMLLGHTDWLYLDYNFRDSPGYADGAPVGDEPEEMTYEMRVAIDTMLPPACVGDINHDGAVGVSDLLEVLATWGGCADEVAACVQDLDENGDVGVGDLLTLLATWGACP